MSVELTLIDRLARFDLQELLVVHPLPELREQRLFITGATGFFGYWLLVAIDVLNSAGQNLEVVAVSRDPSRFAMRHPALAAAPWLRVLRGDVRSTHLPDGPFDSIIHGACDTSAAAAAAPLTLYDSIVTGSRRVLEHAVKVGCSRVLLLGSGAVYGTPASAVRLAEDLPWTAEAGARPDAYTEGKRAMEKLAAATHASNGVDIITARCFAFVGPGLPLDGHFAIGNFIADALAQRPIRISGSGKAERSYLYAADLAVWLLTLLLRGEGGKAYNVGSDHGHTVLQIAETVRDELAPGLPIDIMSPGACEPRPYYVPEIEQARSTIGLRVWTPLGKAIRRTARARGQPE